MDKDLPMNTADGTVDRGRPSDHLSQLSFGISTSLYQLKYTHFLLKRKKRRNRQFRVIRTDISVLLYEP